MPRFPGTLNGQRQQQKIEVNFPWPPGQMGASNVPMSCRKDVENVLSGFRRSLLEQKVPFGDFVWAVHRNPAGVLMAYLFHAGCIPYSQSDPWVFRPLAVDPPPDETWELKFVQLAAVPDAPSVQ